jgi:hypothetical protein
MLALIQLQLRHLAAAEQRWVAFLLSRVARLGRDGWLVMRIERITFTEGRKSNGFRTVENGFVQGYYDDEGTPLKIGEGVSYFVADVMPESPLWFTPTPDPVIPLEPEPVPQAATKLQLRNAAKKSNKWAFIKAAIAAADEDTREGWELATEIHRDNPLVNALAAAAGWSKSEVDDLFRLAARMI